jgi:hypothetical protein
LDQIDAKTQLPPQEIFEAVDARMRAERWDDMRAWKRQRGIPCEGDNPDPNAQYEPVSFLLIRTGGWYRGKSLASA